MVTLSTGTIATGPPRTLESLQGLEPVFKDGMVREGGKVRHRWKLLPVVGWRLRLVW